MADLKDAMQQVISHLDEIMQESPSKEVADASNLLEDLKEKL